MSNSPRSESFNPFPLATWVAWLGATLVAAVTMVAYAYTTFETKDEAKEHTGNVMQRLDRMETTQDRMEVKIDQLRERRPGH